MTAKKEAEKKASTKQVNDERPSLLTLAKEQRELDAKIRASQAK